MHALLEAAEESCWLQWDGSCVWRGIGACRGGEGRRTKTPRENIVLCCFSLSSDTKTHSQGEVKVLLFSFVPACFWGAFGCPLRLALEAHLGCRAAQTELWEIWGVYDREGPWCWLWSLWALPYCLALPEAGEKEIASGTWQTNSWALQLA